MIDIEEWRTSIGLFLYSLYTASRKGELRRFKVCEFDIAALILLSGDVETNPGPAVVAKRDLHRKRILERILVLLLVIQATEQVTLQQTVPPNSKLVCPGEKLVYTCTSETGTLRWETTTGTAIFFSSDNINDTDTVPEFYLLLVSISGLTVVSTATANMIKSSDANKRIECDDGITSLSREILISEKPGNCQGFVSCSAIASQDSSKSAIITVSLAVLGPIHCASFYEFVLGDDNMVTNETSVTFTNYSYGMPYENQEIYVLNRDGTRGTVPCYYSITAPNAIQAVLMAQNCMGNTIQLIFIYIPPTLPLGSCLNPAQLLWEYAINLTGNVTGDFVTTENTFEVNMTQLGAFTIEITPTLPVLGLSGSPLITTFVVTALCKPELPSSSVGTSTHSVTALGEPEPSSLSSTSVTMLGEPSPSSPNVGATVASLAVFVILTVILLTMLIIIPVFFVAFIWKLKSHHKKEDDNSSEKGGTPKQSHHHGKRTPSVSSEITDSSFIAATTPLVSSRTKRQGERTEIESSPEPTCTCLRRRARATRRVECDDPESSGPDQRGGAKERTDPSSTPGTTPGSGSRPRGKHLSNEEDVVELRSEFEKDNYPSTDRKQGIANRLGLHYTTVDNWFKRERAKQRTRENVRRVEAVSLLAIAETETEDVVKELSSSQVEVYQKEVEKLGETRAEREEMKETRKNESEEGKGVIMEVAGTRTEETEWKEDVEKISQLRDRVREQEAQSEKTRNETMRQRENLQRLERKLQEANERLQWREQEAERIKADAQTAITKLLTKMGDLEKRYQLQKFAAKRAVPDDTKEAFPSDSGLETEMPFLELEAEQYGISVGPSMVSYTKPEYDTSPHQFNSDEMIVAPSTTKL